jgi:hypothetical protein
MTLNKPAPKFTVSPLQLIVIMGVFQLFVTLLTYGFTLSFSEAMWHYIGRNWFRHGLTPYAGGVDNKSPLVFAIYGLSDALFGVNYWFPRVLGVVVQCIGLYYVYKIALHIAGKRAGMFAILIYGLALMWKVTDGKLASVTQTYEITCIIISFYFLLKAENGRHRFVSGVMAGLGFGFRISACFGIFALFVSSWRRGFKSALLFAIGAMAAGVMLLLAAYLAGIHFHDLFFYGFKDNFGSGSPTDHNLVWKMEQFAEDFINSEMVLLYPGALAYIIIVKKVDWLVLWMICAFVGINIVGMYDKAHLKDLLPSLVLANAFALAWAIQKYGLPLRPMALVIGLAFFPKLVEPLLSFKKLVVGEDNTGEQYCKPPYPELDNYIKKKLGWWIRDNTGVNDKVLVAGDGAEVMVYTERIAPSIYFNATKTAEADLTFIKDMQANNPDMIAIPLSSAYERDADFVTRDLLRGLIANKYHLERCLYGYNIYRLNK